MGQGSSSNAGTPQRPSPAMVRSEGAVASAATAAATADTVSEVAQAEAMQEDGEDDGEDSFNYNSESSEDDKFPTAVMLQLPDVQLQGERGIALVAG